MSSKKANNVTHVSTSTIGNTESVSSGGGTGTGTDTGGFANFIELTGSGSYTPSANVTKIKVTVVGAGGGGGGAEVLNSGSEDAMGGAGGAGAIGIAWYTVINLSLPIAYSVGAGGLAGTVTGSGGQGSLSSFGNIIATGGQGGTLGINAPGDTISSGGTGGTSSGANINLSGGDGSNGRIIDGNATVSALSGSNLFAPPKKHNVSTSDGADGNFPGGGASGGQNFSSISTGREGGTGADGTIWIEEFY